MADLSYLSDENLQRLYQISKQESGVAPDTSTVQSPRGATGSMQVMPDTATSPGYGVAPSNGTPQDTARVGRDYYLALQDHYKDPMTAAIAYNWGPGNTDKWLASGGDLSKLPDETLKYAYSFNKNAPTQPSQSQAPQAQQPTPTDYSKMSDEELKKAYAQQPNSIMENLKGAGLQALNLGAGALETPAILGAAAIGGVGRALGGTPLAENLEQTMGNVGKNYQMLSPENALNKMGVDTSGVKKTTGYQVPSEVMNYLGETLPGQLAAAGTPGSPFAAAQTLSPEQQRVAKPALQLAELAAPMLHIPGVKEGAPGGAIGKLAPDDAAAPSAQFVGPPRDTTMGPNAGPPRPAITVNPEGVASTNLGNEQTQAGLQNQQAGIALGQQRQLAAEQQAAGTLFPETVTDTTGQASPYNPNRLAGTETEQRGTEPVQLYPQANNAYTFVGKNGEPFHITVDTDEGTIGAFDSTGKQVGTLEAAPLRNYEFAEGNGAQASWMHVEPQFQRLGINSAMNEVAARHIPDYSKESNMFTEDGQRWFNQAGRSRPDLSPTTPEGIATREMPTTEMRQRELNLNPVQDKMQALRDQTPEQLDIFGDHGVPGRVEEEGIPRHLNENEFAQTIQDLATKDGNRFPIPDDMNAAYERYLNSVRDDQGNLFERKQIAKNFVDASVKEALDRRVNDHPTVVANQAKVDSLSSQIAADAANGSRTTALEAARDRAQRTLDQSKENIGRYFKSVEEVGAPKVGPDGVVHMYTFGHLPTLMKSIGAILKGLHGVVFKTLDRVLPNFKNLDSGPKIMAQGMKNFINREATRDWSQTVNAKPIEQLGKVPGLRDAVTELNPHAQDDLSPEQLKQQFNQAPDLSDSKVGNFLRNNVLQGGLMVSDFSRHPLVKFTTDSVAKAFRAADKWNRENLLNQKSGLAPMIKRMNLQEFTEMRSLMEAYEGVKEFTANELKGRGFSDKQIEYYQRSLELQKDAFNKFNAGRQLAGLPPISPRIAHIAGYFTGDFKQIVKDSSGRVVAVLGHNNRAALATVAKRFQELHPDGANLDMGKPTLNKNVAAGDNTFNGFMNILNEMSKTNADVERLVQAYHDTQMAATNKLSQMANRAKFKSNPESRVGGAEGQKLWQSMEKNAQDGGKQQLKYLESLNRWSEFQQAIKKAEDSIKDPEVNAPNAKSISQAYLDNQMHRNLGELNKFTNSLSNGFAEITGVGPTQMRQMANLTKTGLLNIFVGLGKFSHSLVTSLQPFIGSPEVTSVLKSRGANISAAEQFTSMFKGLNSSKDILQAAFTKQPIKDPFVRAANQYARDNDTFNTSQFNMGTVTRPPSKLGTALHINVTVPESGARMATYMRYVHLLKDASDAAPIADRLSDKEIFGSAHNAVQKVMADYNREAAAPLYNKMGFLGDLTRMLTTFKMNQLSQAATATKMFKQGQIAPMITMLATSVAASGLRGFIGYNIANAAIGQITTWATKQGLMSQPTNLDQMVLHMLHGVNKNLADALNFGATSGLGIDMTGSLSHADDIPDDPIGTLLPEGEPIGKMLGSSLTALEHPNKQNAKAALYDALPNSMKGIMENQAYTDEKGNYYDPHTGNLVSNRSPADQMKRNFSFRPLEESKMRLQAEVDKGHEQQLGAVKSEIVKRALSDADSKSLTPQSMQQYAQEYVKAGGDPNELVSSLTTHLGINKNLNIQQREQGMAKGFTGAEHYQRAQEYK